MTKCYIGINSAAEKGYAVGVYDSETHHAIFETSGFHPNFARVIKRVTELAILYPESCKEGIRANISPSSGKEELSSWEREDAIKGLQKLIEFHAQGLPKCMVKEEPLDFGGPHEVGEPIEYGGEHPFKKDGDGPHPFKKY